jgi:molybdopterin converting factor small subunit
LVIQEGKNKEMSIKVDIPPYLQPYTNNTAMVEVDGSTVGECIGYLISQFPGIEKMLFAESRQLHAYVSIYVNGEDTYPEELARPVKDGDEIYVLYIIGGG